MSDRWPEWKEITCFMCGGTGQVSDYGDGEDFYGPKECHDCLGSGTQWASPRGAVAVYPGGPFRGRMIEKGAAK